MTPIAPRISTTEAVLEVHLSSKGDGSTLPPAASTTGENALNGATGALADEYLVIVLLPLA